MQIELYRNMSTAVSQLLSFSKQLASARSCKASKNIPCSLKSLLLLAQSFLVGEIMMSLLQSDTASLILPSSSYQLLLDRTRFVSWGFISICQLNHSIRLCFQLLECIQLQLQILISQSSNQNQMIKQNFFRHDHAQKLVLFGDSKVGKSSIRLRIAKNQFSEQSIATQGIELSIKAFHLIDDSILMIRIWDMEHQNVYKSSILRVYTKEADVAIFVYDISKRETFQSIKDHQTKLREQMKDNIITVLMGNKNDVSQRKVDRTEAQAYAKQTNMIYFEGSAKTGENVTEIIKQIVRGQLFSIKKLREGVFSEKLIPQLNPTKNLSQMILENLLPTQRANKNH